VPSKTTRYSRQWAISIVEEYRKTYPRAFNISCTVLGIFEQDVVETLQKSPQAWERFKKITKIINHWVVSYGELYLRSMGDSAFMADLAKILDREHLLHKSLVLTSPWKCDSIEEHGLIGGVRGVVLHPENAFHFSGVLEGGEMVGNPRADSAGSLERSPEEIGEQGSRDETADGGGP